MIAMACKGVQGDLLVMSTCRRLLRRSLSSAEKWEGKRTCVWMLLLFCCFFCCCCCFCCCYCCFFSVTVVVSFVVIVFVAVVGVFFVVFSVVSAQ